LAPTFPAGIGKKPKWHTSAPSPKSLWFRRSQLAVFQGASEAPIPPHFCLLLVWLFRSRRKNGAGRVERVTRKNSQLAAAHRVALKMGRRLRCSSVTYRFKYAPSSRLAGGPF
jgi:hypothetical protein